MEISAQLAGVAGEYYVAAELSQRGWVAAITMRNTRGIDILVSSPDGRKQVTIQCKTSREPRKDWILSEKSEDVVSDSHFYVFVDLQEAGKRPNFHIIPSAVVAKQISESHAAWLEGKRKDGSQRVDSSMRRFQDKEDRHLERWEALGF